MHVEHQALLLAQATWFRRRSVELIVEERGDVEAAVVHVALEVVDVEQHAAARSRAERVEEAGLGVVARRLRQKLHVLEQEGERVALQDDRDALADHVERRVGRRQSEHRAEEAPVDARVRQVLAVPGDLDRVEDLVEQAEVLRRPAVVAADRQPDAVHDDRRVARDGAQRGELRRVDAGPAALAGRDRVGRDLDVVDERQDAREAARVMPLERRPRSRCRGGSQRMRTSAMPSKPWM